MNNSTDNSQVDTRRKLLDTVKKLFEEYSPYHKSRGMTDDNARVMIRWLQIEPQDLKDDEILYILNNFPPLITLSIFFNSTAPGSLELSHIIRSKNQEQITKLNNYFRILINQKLLEPNPFADDYLKFTSPFVPLSIIIFRDHPQLIDKILEYDLTKDKKIFMQNIEKVKKLLILLKQKRDFKYYFKIENDDELDNLENIFSDMDFVIKSILFYREESGSKQFIELFKKDENSIYKLRDLMAVLKNNGLLEFEYIPETVQFFKHYPVIVDEILQKKTLNDNEKEIIRMLIQEYHAGLKIIHDTGLSQIGDARTLILMKEKQWLNSEFYSEVKSAILNIYGHGIPTINGEYPSIKFLEHYHIDIPVELRVLYEIKEKVDSMEDLESLKKECQHILEIYPIPDYKILSKVANDIETTLWNKQFSREEEEGKITYVDGTSISNKTNRAGDEIKSSDKVKVYTLDGQPFRFLAHVVSSGGGPNFANRVLDITSNPELWETGTGSTYISSSMISNTLIRLAWMPGEKDIIYGFNTVQNTEIILALPGDAKTTHVNGEKELSRKTIDTPNYLEANTDRPYNEVALKRVLGNKRVLPDFIICLDGYISENSKLAAQYFNIPIYMIHRKKYKEIDKANKEKYDNGLFIKFDKSDIDYLLFSRCLYKGSDTIGEIVKYCFDALEHAYSEKIITPEQYEEYNQYIVDSLECNNFEPEYIIYAKIIARINTGIIKTMDESSLGELYEKYRSDETIPCFFHICSLAAKKDVIDKYDTLKYLNNYLKRTGDVQPIMKAKIENLIKELGIKATIVKVQSFLYIKREKNLAEEETKKTIIN